MIKNEENIIDYIKSNIKTKSKDVLKSIGDDCAVIKINKSKSFVVTTDTSLLGPHFSKDYLPYEIGYKSLATNLSDIAAMGCKPLYIFMAITIPDLNSSWIKSFYKGVKKLTTKHNVALIGGDTNKGPLSISIQVIGINKHKILYRNGAKPKDDIYVSGDLGSARSALIFKSIKNKKKEFLALKKFLHTPTPRVELGLDLSKFATSCIDVSDGLAKDVSNIIKEAKCGAQIYLDKIPHKLIIKKALPKNRLYEAIIGGGEDYELCFTANSKDSKKIKYLSKKHKIKITKIGTITKRDLKYYDHDKEIKMNLKGFDHFSS
jgi:thiamine-monophosphate kinase